MSSYRYTYYPDGNIASITETGRVTYYSYDGYGRLTEERTVANNKTKIVSYTYDNNGNRTSKTENGVLTSYTYDNNNRITTDLQELYSRIIHTTTTEICSAFLSEKTTPGHIPMTCSTGKRVSLRTSSAIRTEQMG